MSAPLRRDVILLAICAGVAGVLLLFGGNLTMGKAARMGPGYFPVLVAVGITLTGIAIAIRMWRRDAGAPVETPALLPVSWRAVAAISASVIVFALLVRPAGFLPASLATVLVCTAAQAEYSGWVERLALAGGLAVLSSLVFVSALGLPFTLLPAMQ